MGDGFLQLWEVGPPKQVGDEKLKSLPHTLNIVELFNINRGSSVFKLAYIIAL